ncbi:hypothetical protein [Amycolatopsis sp. FDAARGOS 1241]|uniref:hypothetical protein n=1 Tax=Amycolatopsis sp. FDAARGOS 1241 TaxID=2778070 RepID=UPI001951D743|nr:hypothetical protein [Amycolatopsis sp. FDAARGOS 1241]QRP49485.1 hypothetical protein I6J71_18030 [Amycolatopsis sp. FDAARGOS 1241]
MTGIRSLGLRPSALDYSRHPGLDEATLPARIAAAEAALRDAGFGIVSFLVPADPDEAAQRVRAVVAANPPRVAIIGGAVPMAAEHTLRFERVVNLLTRLVPGIAFCFTTSPETTTDALRRAAG